jgi:CBS-domain-containing membrane protein
LIRARNIMHKRVARIQPEATLVELIHTLVREGVSGVPVVEQDCRLAGVVSATDLLAAVARSLTANPDTMAAELNRRTVKEIMTPVALAVGADTPVTELAHLLHKAKVHRALIVEDGRLSGIVTAFDVLRAASQPATDL